MSTMVGGLIAFVWLRHYSGQLQCVGAYFDMSRTLDTPYSPLHTQPDSFIMLSAFFIFVFCFLNQIFFILKAKMLLF
jgi:hypothetical protein